MLHDLPATALVPLWARAVEARSDEPLLVDDHAVEILERLGFDASVFDTMNVMARETTVAGTIVRTAQIDAKVRTIVGEHPGTRVVTLGCGLEARSRRLDDGATTWLDVDLPPIIELRERMLAAGERQRTMAASMFDDKVLAELAAPCEHPPVVVWEGVLLYFTPEEVYRLLVRLAQAVPRATLVFDVVGTALCEQHHPGVLAIGQDLPVAWGIDDHAVLGRLHPALHYVEFESAYDRFSRRWRVLSEMLPMLRERVGQGIVTMKIGRPHRTEP